MKTLLVAGGDKLGRAALREFAQGREPRDRGGDLILAEDASGGLGRIGRLLSRGSIKPLWLFRMALAEFQRPAVSTLSWPKIRSNRELLALARESGAGRILLYRAGLIVGPLLLRSGIEILNIHCARLPDYGGLGALPRALAAGDFRQEACLHRVVERIDAGEVLDRELFQQDPALSYGKNEGLAYAAGLRLLKRTLT